MIDIKLVTTVHLAATLADPNHSALWIADEPQPSGGTTAVNLTGSTTVIPVRVEPYLLPNRTYMVTVRRDLTAPEVQFDSNGSVIPGKTAATQVTVTDAESGLDPASLQYAWAQSAAAPAEGWNAFTDGDLLTQASGDGNWYLHIRAVDRKGNVAYAVSNPYLLDNTPPSIVLNGSNPMHVPVGYRYEEPGATATDIMDGEIPPSSVAIAGDVNSAIPGEYQVVYQAADRAGNATSVTRSVYVYLGDAPSISLIGPNPMVVAANSDFADPGATAYDAEDGDLSDRITVTGSVDMALRGHYTLSYNVVDLSGNEAPSVTRDVYVIDPPVITLFGEPVMRLTAGEPFSDPGGKAEDSYYGDISARITVTGTVNTQVPGTYTLRYNVQNPAGIAAAEMVRTVTVVRGREDSGPSYSSQPTVIDPKAPIIKVDGSNLLFRTTEETGSDGMTVTRFTVDADSFAQAIHAHLKDMVVEIQNSPSTVKIDLPASALLDAMLREPEASIRIVVEGASYTLPLRVLNDAPDSATVTVGIARASETENAAVNQIVKSVGAQPLLDRAISFSLWVNDKEITDFNGSYVVRTITIDALADANSTTAVWIDERNRLHFVPSVLAANGESTIVTIFAPHNSLYTVIQSSRSFSDLQGHWAQADVLLLANKQIVEGETESRFNPNKQITRAEFAALLVRSLGLAEPGLENPFTDVTATDWYAGAVAAALQAGLINGHEDRTFKPNESITREQMATMIARALNFAGNAPQANVRGLDQFTDSTNIAGWAKESVAALLAAKIIEGVDETKFAPKVYTTRAQSAAMVKRMLQYLQFID